VEHREVRQNKHMGPDPHARPLDQLIRAYGMGALSTAPQTLLNPRLPRAALDRLTFRRIRATIQHAMAHVPFYRDHFAAAGVRPDELVGPAEVARVPLLTKPLLRANSHRMLADNAPPREELLERSSSGSSGSPVSLLFDPLRELPRRIQELRLLTAHGFRPWHVQLVFDHPGHMAPGKFFPQRLGLWRREVFPCWLPIEDALVLIRELQPEILHGVLSSLRMLSLAVKARQPLPYRPKLIVSKGELLDPGTRALIEGTLGAKQADYYATEETGIIAWECPSGSGYHIDQDFVYVETVRADGTPTEPGESGEIVLTNLYMRAMPFIRYRVGDLGTLSPDPCPCGRSLPLLKNLLGRRLDLIVTPSGEIHQPFALMVAMEGVPEVRRYRIQQKALDHILAEVCWESGLGDDTVREARARIVAAMHERLGEQIRIEVQEVADFEHGLGEKFPLVRGLGQSVDQLSNTKYHFRF
jgi:phenylacetate-CoA ligase